MYREEWQTERAERALNGGPIKFGVPYLDDALGGILKNDLLLIGAKTGRGKTALAAQMAQDMARRGKNVVFYALEADKWEIHTRMLYREMGRLFFEHLAKEAKGIQFPRYREFICAGADPDWLPLENAAQEKLHMDTLSLRIVYKGGNFGAAQFAKELEAHKADGTDVVIVDHLHYFDLDEKSETEGLKKAVHAVRNAALFNSTPIILLGHLRKSDRRSERSTPHLEDFHGHSDIVKVATTVLLLSPVPEKEGATSDEKSSFRTYFHIAKARTAAEVTPFVAIHSFSLARNQYSREYQLCRDFPFKDPEPVPYTEIPRWAVNAMKNVPDRNAPYVLAQRDLAAGGSRD
jgi:replicative DNA helicase